MNPYQQENERHRMSNPQIALICATDMDPGTYRQPDGDARTDRVLARAHQFLAFLIAADEGTRHGLDGLDGIDLEQRPDLQPGTGPEADPGPHMVPPLYLTATDRNPDAGPDLP